MKLKDILAETPITDLKLIGDWDKNHGFRTVDRRILTNPKIVERMKEKFDNVSQDIALYFVNIAGKGKFQEQGEVSVEWVEKNLGTEASEAATAAENSDAIVVFFCGNSADQRIPMTPWIVAHRLGHVFARGGSNIMKENPVYKTFSDTLISDVGDIMTEYYGYRGGKKDRLGWGRGNGDGYADQSVKVHVAFMEAIGMFKSARDENIRNWFEFPHEVLAQYIMTGKVKFNSAPEKFGTSAAYGRKNYYRLAEGQAEEATQALETMARTAEFNADDVLSYAVGRIWVM